jgi:hypothetical protein
MLNRLRQQTGQALIVSAIALPLFLGFALLVVDGSKGFLQKRQVQNAADAAALAAAQDLKPALGTCDAACLASVRSTAKATVESYSARNDGPAQLDGGSGGDPAQCTQPSDTNCYTWPYNGSNGKIEVRLRTTVNTFFTRFFGIGAGILRPKARAVASAVGITVDHCVFTPPVVNPDQYLPSCIIPGGGGENLVGFAGSTACNAINFTGTSPSLYPAGIWSNGGYSISGHNGNAGIMLVSQATSEGCISLNEQNNDWPVDEQGAHSTVATPPSPATTGTSLIVAAGTGSNFPALPFSAEIWPAGADQMTSTGAVAGEMVRVTARAGDTLTIQRGQEGTTKRSVIVGDQIAAERPQKVPALSIPPDSNWPVPFPTINVPADCKTSTTGALSVDNTWYADPTKNKGPGIYCATGTISIGTTGATYNGYTFYTTSNITVPQKDNIFTGSVINGCKVVLYALASGNAAVHIGQPNEWHGDIYTPNGETEFTGGGKPFEGYIQAQTIQMTGGGSQYTGTGPVKGGTGPIVGTKVTTVTGANLSMDE